MPSGCLLPVDGRGCLHPEVPEAHEAWKDLGNCCLQICGLLVLRQGLVLWQKQVAMSRGWCAMSAPLLCLQPSWLPQLRDGPNAAVCVAQQEVLGAERFLWPVPMGATQGTAAEAEEGAGAPRQKRTLPGVRAGALLGRMAVLGT